MNDGSGHLETFTDTYDTSHVKELGKQRLTQTLGCFASQPVMVRAQEREAEQRDAAWQKGRIGQM